MKTNTRDRIYNYISENNPVSINDIKLEFGISTQMIHRHINKLLGEKKIYKSGQAPKVYYFMLEDSSSIDIPILGSISDYTPVANISLDEKFVNFAPDGNVTYGFEGFKKWCIRRNMDPEKEIETYLATQDKYDSHRTKYGVIKGIEKMRNTFDDVGLDKVYYLDFYSIEKYGKTFLGNLMLYAKQTGDRELTQRILNNIRQPIYDLIKKKKIDAYGFIPPSIDRPVQLMSELEKGLDFGLKKIKLQKIFKDKIVAQKSLSKKEDRIINARDTIYVMDKKFQCDTILLIDDAVGSGATLNETAKKIKQKGYARKVIGLAIVGSYKGFEVINEV